MIGGDRYNRMNRVNSLAAGQGGSGSSRPVFAKATPAISKANTNGLFNTIGGLAENIYAGNLANLDSLNTYENYTFLKCDICDFKEVKYIFKN